jgi:protein TonB
MKLEIMFTTSDLILFSGAALVTILGLIFILRRYMNHQAEVDLTEKYKDKEWKSPLEARTKYPDVDAFRLRGYILRFSFVMTLAVALFAFNWTSYEQEVFIPDDALALEEEIEIEPPRTQEAQPPPPPPPPPQIQEVPETEIIEEDESIFQDMSVDAETQIFDAPVADTDAEADVPPPPPPPPPPSKDIEEIFKVVEQMPRFPGCEDLGTENERKACASQKMLEFIYANIEYPMIARENNIEGTVVVQFVVDRSGTIRDINTVRDIGGGCGEEAVRIVNMMNEMDQKWVPGMQQGRPVNVLFNLPVRFKLL